MRTVCLILARFAIAAWVGAAVLFVITSIQEARSPLFDSVTKAELANLRFPSYYAFGFTLVAASLACGLWARKAPAVGARQMTVFLLLTGIALVVMAADYVWIYRPLSDMIAQPTEARPARFQTLHQFSQYVNTVHIGLCLAAALVIHRPGSRSTPFPAE